jgi:septal ring-binding cell division protein DamX
MMKIQVYTSWKIIMSVQISLRAMDTTTDDEDDDDEESEETNNVSSTSNSNDTRRRSLPANRQQQQQQQQPAHPVHRRSVFAGSGIALRRKSARSDGNAETSDSGEKSSDFGQSNPLHDK